MGSVLLPWDPQASVPPTLPASLSLATTAQANPAASIRALGRGQAEPPHPEPMKGSWVVGFSCISGALGHVLNGGCCWLRGQVPQGYGRISETDHSSVIMGPRGCVHSPKSKGFPRSSLIWVEVGSDDGRMWRDLRLHLGQLPSPSRWGLQSPPNPGQSQQQPP